MPLSLFPNMFVFLFACRSPSLPLGSNVFSGSTKQAERIGRQLQAGMTSINDFATTYMCQSLPFGGIKDSGFDKFAGVEGLRGCCVAKAVVVDKYFFMKTTIPEPLKCESCARLYSFCTSFLFFFLKKKRAAVANTTSILLLLLLLLADPVSSSAFGFVKSLVRMFYGFTPIERLQGILGLAVASIAGGKKPAKTKEA